MDEAEYTIPANILRHFDLSSTPYNDERVSAILARRRVYPGGKLFVDQLLQHAEVDSVSLYPPTSPAGYRRLLALIHVSPLDRLKRDCLYYILLKDYARFHEGDERAEQFSKARGLSKTWRVFMDGYWDLDNGNWESAITNLTNPAITEVNFPSDIVHALATQCSPPALACSLIHDFLLTRIPSNTGSEGDIEIYTTALASASGVPSAFGYIRSLDPALQAGLREVVWAWSLGAPMVPCGLPSPSPSAHVVQQTAIKEVLHLPLLPDEDDHLLHFLLSPPKSAPISPVALSLLHDLVTLRLIHQGKYAESLQLDRELAGSGGGKEDDRQRRREMVREFIAILPEAQRRALALGGSDAAVTGGDKEMEVEVNGVIDLDPDSEEPTAIVSPFPLEASAVPAPPTPAPAPAARVVSTSTHSPFAGPPRFAPNPNLPSDSPRGTPVQRVLSGSPFTLPMSKGANAVRSASFSRPQTPTQQVKALPIPRPKPRPTEHEQEPEEQSVPPKRILSRQERMDVDVDEEEREPTPLKAHEPAAAVEEEEELINEGQADIPIEQPTATTVPTPRALPTRRSKRTTTVSPPAPAPAPARRSSRQTSVPASTSASTAPTSPGIHHLPGTFEPVPEDRPLQSTSASAGGMTRSRTRRQLSAAPASAPAPDPPRSRMIRSASRATLGDPDELPPAPKRARSRRLSAASEMTEMTPRRTTRRGGKEEQQSERGSPTPSVASRTTRATSQTPRKSTRSRK